MPTDSIDSAMMRRCFDLARAAHRGGELPFGSVVARGGDVVSAEGNRVRVSGDATRHAEVCAIVAAQAKLGRPALDGCTLYTNIEPCAFCAYAIRETRIARVVYALGSPLMGGASRWDVLHDEGLGRSMPDVFAPPPDVRAGFLAEEADEMLKRHAPVIWAASHARGLFVCDEVERHSQPAWRAQGVWGAVKARALDALRRRLFDRFSRGAA